MQLPPLTSGRIQRRYKRFLADVILDDGSVVTAHCPNTGSMASCWEAGAPVQLSFSDNPKRRLPWTLERVDMGGGWIGVHTGRTNEVIAEAITDGRVTALDGYSRLRREVRFEPEGRPRSRFDIFLSGGDRRDAWVEVKNTTLLDGESVRFPDAVTQRGLKHLDMLALAVAMGCRGVLVFAVNRPEGRFFAPAWSIDETYARRLGAVISEGVEVLAVRIRHTACGLAAHELLPVNLGR